ncbi:hypothetical protein K1W54_15570 [Micromonospora sp. CPCC 205371]|nr:hypothetical protein [Micromonospora sp. CPCC 205371]
MRAPRVVVLVVAVAVTVATGANANASPVAGWTSRISNSVSGDDPNDVSYRPAISADGRNVAYASAASNLVPEDVNPGTDIFVTDTRTGATSKGNLTSTGSQINLGSVDPDISADGRYVTFVSYGTNIVAGDPNPLGNVYVRDRVAGTTARVTPPNLSGDNDMFNAFPSISADGRYVAFATPRALVPEDTNNELDIYVWARETGALERVSVSADFSDSNGSNHRPDISQDGRYVAFSSFASNLVSNDTNNTWDVFIRDRLTGATSRASVSTTGAEGNAETTNADISGDGRYVVFGSYASNLVAGDTNGDRDAFLHDRATGRTELVSVSPTGGQFADAGRNPVVSANGRYVAFTARSEPAAVQQVLRRDRWTGTTIMVSLSTAGAVANADCDDPAISRDGLGIAFSSTATNLVPRDTEPDHTKIFLRRYWR